MRRGFSSDFIIQKILDFIMKKKIHLRKVTIDYSGKWRSRILECSPYLNIRRRYRSYAVVSRIFKHLSDNRRVTWQCTQRWLKMTGNWNENLTVTATFRGWFANAIRTGTRMHRDAHTVAMVLFRGATGVGTHGLPTRSRVSDLTRRVIDAAISPARRSLCRISQPRETRLYCVW